MYVVALCLNDLSPSEANLKGQHRVNNPTDMQALWKPQSNIDPPF